MSTPGMFLRLALGLLAAHSAAAYCPAHCHCGPLSTDKSAQNWIIALSAYRHQKLIVGPGRNYHRVGDDEVALRQMTCVGLNEMPSSIPPDVKKVMIYGDRHVPAYRQQLRDQAKTGHVDWDEAFVGDGSNEFHQLKQVKSETFSGASELQELFVEGNDIKAIQPAAFSAVPKLSLLSFRKNNLKELGAEALHGLGSLKDADFSRNEISSIDEHAFSHLNNLRTLSLGSNVIADIGQDHMKDLVNLMELDISSNRLHDIDKHVFISQTNLTILNLSKNRLTSLNSACFEGLANLKSLSLADNGINEIKDGALGSMANLRFLDLSGNSLEILTSSMLLGLSELEELNLERNYIGSIAPLSLRNLRLLRVLRLGYNYMTEFDASTFFGLQSLHVLHLQNNLISELDNAALRAMPGLREISLSKNRLHIIRKGTFRGMNDLREVRLEKNAIKHIEDDAFASAALGQLSKLGWLYLDGNRIRTVSSRTFAGALYLRHLSMSSNELHSLDGRAFWLTRNLIMLALQENKIPELPPYAFLKLKALRVLNIGGNVLSSLNNDSFSGMGSLEELTVAGNHISGISNNTFGDLRALVRLDISKNALTALDMDSMLNASRLRYIDASKNRIKTVSSRGKSLRSQLKSFNLADNALEALDEAVATSIARGGEFHLYGNPWNCDCHLEWLTRLYNASQIVLANADKVVCKTPSSLSSSEVVQIPSTELVCTQDKAHQQKIVPELLCRVTVEELSSMSAIRKRSRKEIQRSAVTVFRRSDRKAHCHGLMLNSAWALTSASCWRNMDMDASLHGAITVVGPGGDGWTSYTMAGAQKDLVAQKVTPHPDYVPGAKEHDIAAVHLGGAFDSRNFSGQGPPGFPMEHTPCILDEQQLLVVLRRNVVGWTTAKEINGRRVDVEAVPIRATLNDSCASSVGGKAPCPVLVGRVLLGRDLDLSGAGLQYGLQSQWAIAGFQITESADPRSSAGRSLFLPLFRYIGWLQQTMSRGP